jgi:hypothetical protein
MNITFSEPSQSGPSSLPDYAAGTLLVGHQNPVTDKFFVCKTYDHCSLPTSNYTVLPIEQIPLAGSCNKKSEHKLQTYTCKCIRGTQRSSKTQICMRSEANFCNKNRGNPSCNEIHYT